MYITWGNQVSSHSIWNNINFCCMYCTYVCTDITVYLKFNLPLISVQRMPVQYICSFLIFSKQQCKQWREAIVYNDDNMLYYSYCIIYKGYVLLKALSPVCMKYTGRGKSQVTNMRLYHQELYSYFHTNEVAVL